jgi:hypothetical protein
MIGKYAFSFDRESFRGSYNSRKEAVTAALEAARNVEGDPPASVYIACRAPLDPHASGHAEDLIERMRQAVRDDAEAEAADAFLNYVTDQELADLDDAVERAIRGWLAKHDLLTASGRLSAISEHPVPVVAGVARGDSSYREVGEIGEI